MQISRIPKKNPYCAYQLDDVLCWFFNSTLQSTCRCHKWLVVSRRWNGHNVRNVSKKLHRKWAKNGKFSWLFQSFIQEIFCFVLNILHGWWAMDFRICLAPKYHGCLISDQSYEFYPHLAQLDIIDVTMSLNKTWTRNILNINCV